MLMPQPECIRSNITSRLHHYYKLDWQRLPRGAGEKDPHVPILVSKDILSCKRIVVFFGDNIQEMGTLSGRLINEKAIWFGSCIGWVKHIRDSDPRKETGIVIANCGELIWSRKQAEAVSMGKWYAIKRKTIVDPPYELKAKNQIPGNRDVEEHIRCVFDQILRPIVKQSVVSVNVISVAQSTNTLIRVLQEDWSVWKWHMSSIVTAGSFTFTNQDIFFNDDFSYFWRKRCRAYMLPSGRNAHYVSESQSFGCPMISSGPEPSHLEEILPHVYEEIVDYFKLLSRKPAYQDDLVPGGYIVKPDPPTNLWGYKDFTKAGKRTALFAGNADDPQHNVEHAVNPSVEALSGNIGESEQGVNREPEADNFDGPSEPSTSIGQPIGGHSAANFSAASIPIPGASQATSKEALGHSRLGREPPPVPAVIHPLGRVSNPTSVPVLKTDQVHGPLSPDSPVRFGMASTPSMTGTPAAQYGTRSSSLHPDVGLHGITSHTHLADDVSRQDHINDPLNKMNRVGSVASLATEENEEHVYRTSRPEQADEDHVPEYDKPYDPLDDPRDIVERLNSLDSFFDTTPATSTRQASPANDEQSSFQRGGHATDEVVDNRDVVAGTTTRDSFLPSNRPSTLARTQIQRIAMEDQSSERSDDGYDWVPGYLDVKGQLVRPGDPDYKPKLDKGCDHPVKRVDNKPKKGKGHDHPVKRAEDNRLGIIIPSPSRSATQTKVDDDGVRDDARNTSTAAIDRPVVPDSPSGVPHSEHLSSSPTHYGPDQYAHMQHDNVVQGVDISGIGVAISPGVPSAYGGDSSHTIQPQTPDHGHDHGSGHNQQSHGSYSGRPGYTPEMARTPGAWATSTSSAGGHSGSYRIRGSNDYGSSPFARSRQGSSPYAETHQGAASRRPSESNQGGSRRPSYPQYVASRHPSDPHNGSSPYAESHQGAPRRPSDPQHGSSPHAESQHAASRRPSASSRGVASHPQSQSPEPRPRTDSLRRYHREKSPCCDDDLYCGHY